MWTKGRDVNVKASDLVCTNLLKGWEESGLCRHP